MQQLLTERQKEKMCTFNYCGELKSSWVLLKCLIASNTHYLYDERDGSRGVIGPVVNGDDGGAIGVKQVPHLINRQVTSYKHSC